MYKRQNLNIAAATFIGNRASYGGAIGITVQSGLILADSILTANVADLHGGAVYASIYFDSTLYSSEFNANHALMDGGAMYITQPFGDTQVLTLEDLQFANNSAHRNGGALYFDGRSNRTDVASLLFIGNRAEHGGGGGIYWPSDRPNVSDVVFVNNAAVYGWNEASDVCYIISSGGPEFYANFTQYNGPSYAINPPLMVTLHDCLNQRVIASPFQSVDVKIVNSTVLGGATVAPVRQGLALFEYVYLVDTSDPAVLVFTTTQPKSLRSEPLVLKVGNCPLGTSYAAGVCDLCDAGTYADGTTTFCYPCAPGHYSPNRGISECLECEIGSYSSINGSIACADCASSNAYTLFNGSHKCQPCTTGLECNAGHVSVAAGYWGYSIDNGTAISAVKCLAGFCLGGQPEHGSCAAHRSPTSPLCGQCEDGFVSFLTSSECVECREHNAGMIALILALLWLCVLLVMYLSSGRNEQTAELKVLFFFLSSARIIMGESSTYTQWLGIVDSGGVINLNVCVLALNPYNLSVLEMLFPLVGLTELAVTAVIVKLACYLGLVAPKWYNPNRFIRTAMALLSFRYTLCVLAHFR